jgi:hypothetical protein
MQKFNKVLQDALKSLILVWLLAVTLLTIDQAARPLGWDPVLRVSVRR